ncbi:hypothetical protein SH139x_001637 [Planctomycetaceae bacterium SH139]
MPDELAGDGVFRFSDCFAYWYRFFILGIRGPWQGTVWFFLVLFLGTMAIGVWAEPVGPRAWGVPQLGLIVTAIFVGLLIAITTSSKGSRR